MDNWPWSEELTQLAMAGNCTLLGIGIAYFAYRNIREYMYISSALQKIQLAAEVHPSDLRSFLSQNDEVEKLVVVRGAVELESAIEKWNWKDFLGTRSLISKFSGEEGVILEQCRRIMYNEWRGVFVKSFNQQVSSVTRKVPFVLAEAGNFLLSDFVVVNMDGSKHPLPLETYEQLQHFSDNIPYTIFKAFSGQKRFLTGRLYIEKLLPLGKNITAVGICYLKDGTPEIKSCKDLPFFLSEFTKNQMVQYLSSKEELLRCGGVILGSIALGMLWYFIPRTWSRWKEWREQHNSMFVESDEESGNVPEDELCVICLTRRRRYAFVRCGHVICCQECAFSVQRGMSPKCPLCRQPIRASVRIYN